MARVSRIIIYDSDDEEKLKHQLAKSLPEGLYHFPVKVVVIDVENTPVLSDLCDTLHKLIIK